VHSRGWAEWERTNKATSHAETEHCHCIATCSHQSHHLAVQKHLVHPDRAPHEQALDLKAQHQAGQNAPPWSALQAPVPSMRYQSTLSDLARHSACPPAIAECLQPRHPDSSCYADVQTDAERIVPRPHHAPCGKPGRMPCHPGSEQHSCCVHSPLHQQPHQLARNRLVYQNSHFQEARQQESTSQMSWAGICIPYLCPPARCQHNKGCCCRVHTELVAQCWQCGVSALSSVSHDNIITHALSSVSRSVGQLPPPQCPHLREKLSFCVYGA
jgi:hypothetical protein